MFPKKTLFRPCIEYEVDGGRNFGHGVLDISRAHIFSFMGAFVEGVLHPLFAMQNFSKLFISFHLLWSKLECYVK